MSNRILLNAKEDVPLYFADFCSFWDISYRQISDEDLIEIYKGTLVFKNYRSVFQDLNINHLLTIIDEIFEDINSSLYLCLLGLYRSALMHLRSSIELTMQLIYFVDHSIEFQQWKDGEFLIKHDKLCSYLIKHPNFHIDITGLIGGITKNWKLFSKHIHAESPIFFQCEREVTRTNTFSIADFNKWKSDFNKNIKSLNRLLLLFFKNELPRFSSSNYELLTGLLSENELNELRS